MPVKISLKAMRVNANYTQREAAKKLSVSDVTLISWETGKTAPTVKQLYNLCDLYGCTLDDIFLPCELAKS